MEDLVLMNVQKLVKYLAVQQMEIVLDGIFMMIGKALLYIVNQVIMEDHVPTSVIVQEFVDQMDLVQNFHQILLSIIPYNQK